MKYYLEKGFVIIEHNYNNLSSVPNEVKQKIHAIDIHDLYCVIACYTAITSIKKTINR